MLPKANNLLRIVSVKLVKSAPNAFVGCSGNVRQMGENPLTLYGNVNNAVFDLDVRRVIQKLAQIIHCDSPSFFLDGLDALSRKWLQLPFVVKVPLWTTFAVNRS